VPQLILSTKNGIQISQKSHTVDAGKNNISSSDMVILPFFEDFSHEASKWILPSGVSAKNGHIIWNTGNFNGVKLKNPIPMENIVIEFDGYAETNGINVWLQNNDNKGYTTIFGGWYNTQSGSDIGANEENRQLVSGKVWTPKKWQHYKIVKSGDILAAYCDGRLIFKRVSPKHFEGYGHLKFDSWNAVIGIDNVRIYRINKNQDSGAKKPGVSSIGNNFGKINPDATITITTFHTSPKGVNNIAYTSIVVKDENNKVYIQDPYKTNNNPASRSKKPIPNNHFGVYPTEKIGYTVQELIDAGRSGSVRSVSTRYSKILPDSNAKVIGDKLKVTLHVTLNNFPVGKKYIFARTVDLTGMDSGWQRAGEFSIVKTHISAGNNLNHKNSSNISGDWKWFNGDIAHIYQNGTAKSSNGNRGKWKAEWDGSKFTYVISWNNGQWVDTLVLQGNTLDGHNQNGTHVWGKRISKTVPISKTQPSYNTHNQHNTITGKTGVSKGQNWNAHSGLKKQTNGTSTSTRNNNPIHHSMPSAKLPDRKKLYREYINTYSTLQNLMKQGRGDTPEAQEAYKKYKQAKDRYNQAVKRDK